MTEKRRRLGRLARGLGCVLWVGASGPVLAAPPAAAPASEVTPESEPLRLVLRLGGASSDGPALDPARIARAVRAELGVEVVASAEREPLAGSLLLDLEASPGYVLGEYIDPKGNKTARLIARPADPESALEVLALLAGNLVRNEASELLRELAADKDKSRAPELPQPPPPGPKAKPDKTRADAAQEPLRRGTFHGSVFHPLALDSKSQSLSVDVELGLFYSRLGETRGLGLNLLVLRNHRGAQGVQLGGVFAHAGERLQGAQVSGVVGMAGDAEGLQLSGALGLSLGDLEGAQVAGAAAVSLGEVEGAQVASFGSYAVSRVQGFQLGGFGTWTSGPLEGAQLAGAANVARSLEGVQVAGAANIVPEHVEGFQLSGALNLGLSRVEGVQLASVNVAGPLTGLQLGGVNIAGDVDGFQLGAVNIAGEVDGAALGVISIAKNGRIQPQVWLAAEKRSTLGVAFEVGPIYSLPYFGRDLWGETQRYEWGFAVGAKARYERVWGALEVGYGSEQKQLDDAITPIERSRLLVGFELVPRGVTLFGGLGLRTSELKQLTPESHFGLAFF